MKPQDIKAKLLTYDRMMELYDTNEKPVPYVIAKLKPTKSLVFIGLNHTNDSSDAQFNTVEQEWDKYLKVTDGHKRIVLIEGGNCPVASFADEAIAKYGESGLLTYLASQNEVEVASPEPSREREANELAHEYGQEHVMTYYFIRLVPQWQREHTDLDMPTYVQSILDKYKRILKWEIDFNYRHILGVLETMLDRQLDFNDERSIARLSNPGRDEELTNKIARSCSMYRNINIAHEIINYWDNDVSMFVGYGSGHAYILEPVLDELT